MTNSSHFSLRKAAFLLPALCVATTLTQTAVGAEYTWVGGTGDWALTTSWATGIVPLATDDARFVSASPETAQFNASQTVRKITVSSSVKTFQGIGASRSLTLTGGPTAGSSVSSGLTLDNLTLSKTGTGTLTIQSGGGLTLNSGTYSQTDGTYLSSASSSIGGTGTATFGKAGAGASLQMGNSATLSLASGVNATVNSGNIHFGTSSTLANAGTLTLSGTASFSGSAGTLSNTGTLNVGTLNPSLPTGSTVNLIGGNFNLSITGDATGGRLSVASGGTIALSGGPTLNVTSVDVTEGSAFTILSAGTVSGQFTGLADNAVFTAGSQDYRINYLGSSVTLTAVPEPQHYAGAIGLGLIAFTAFRRSRKSA